MSTSTDHTMHTQLATCAKRRRPDDAEGRCGNIATSPTHSLHTVVNTHHGTMSPHKSSCKRRRVADVTTRLPLPLPLSSSRSSLKKDVLPVQEFSVSPCRSTDASATAVHCCLVSGEDSVEGMGKTESHEHEHEHEREREHTGEKINKSDTTMPTTSIDTIATIEDGASTSVSETKGEADVTFCRRVASPDIWDILCSLVDDDDDDDDGDDDGNGTRCKVRSDSTLRFERKHDVNVVDWDRMDDLMRTREYGAGTLPFR